MSREQFLILNLAFAFYNTGTIWAHEVDIFRSWKLLDPQTFQNVQKTHWRKVPYWVFMPVGLAFLGSIGLFWYRPQAVLLWQVATAFGLQCLSHILTAAFWGPWQAKLSTDLKGGESLFLANILKTHWVRTSLITGYGLMILYITLMSISE